MPSKIVSRDRRGVVRVGDQRHDARRGRNCREGHTDAQGDVEWPDTVLAPGRGRFVVVHAGRLSLRGSADELLKTHKSCSSAPIRGRTAGLESGWKG